MQVTYEVGSEWTPNDFSRAFPFLRNCIFRLTDRLLFFLSRGNIGGFVPTDFDASDYPFLAAATFGKEEAERYEASMRAYFSRPMRKCTSGYPLPKFDVALTVDFRNGSTETHIMPFKSYSDETLLKFCQAVRRSMNKYRNATLYGAGGL